MIKTGYKLFIVIILISYFSLNKSAAQTNKKDIHIYLIPGIAGDYRLYKNLKPHFSKYEITHIKWEIPKKNEDMAEYAKKLSNQIDTSKKYCIIGTSLGGMLATEMADFLRPVKTIIISSAKCRQELPFRYRFQKQLPIYKIFPGKLIKALTYVAQPIVEPDRREEKETCNSMIKKMDPRFLKRSIGMIINWERKNFDDNIIHIHGSNDNTLPIKNIEYTYLTDNGSHLMILTQTDEIATIIKKELKNLK